MLLSPYSNRRPHRDPISQPELLLAGSAAYRAGKRLLDCTVALTMLVLTAPLIALAMLLVKLTSRGPALYSQVRLGKDGVPFTLFKVRTMQQDAESITGARWSTPGDSRITPVGRWLRKTHLDELPQLWNVLCGDMSMIGPRPERPEFVPQLEQAIAYYRARLLIRPGVTGLAQVQRPPDTDLDSVRIKLAYDLHYVRTASLWLDVRIYWATALHVAGISFDRIRALFGFDRPETIDAAYRNLASEYLRRKAELKAQARREHVVPAVSHCFDGVSS